MYLDDLDELLRAGASTLSVGLRERQRRFVLDRQRADGGFAGRLGASDLYYTDFALRVLWLAEEPAGRAEDTRAALERIAVFIQKTGVAPRDVVDWFSVLNVARMLKNCGLNTGSADVSSASQISNLKSQIPIPNPQSAIRNPQSSYHTFLAALSYEMLGEPFPESAAAAGTIAALKRPDGGYTETPSGTAGQTNASAAAVAFLTMRGAITTPDRETVNFFCAMQAPDGGFRASVEAPESDLLSSFTALVTLFALDGFKSIDLTAAVRWIGSLAGEEGGFRAALSDTEPDIEYTYYGLGALALVRAYAGVMRGLEEV